MPGYVIAQINMTNKEGFKVYAEQVPETIKQFGGKYIVRAGEYTSMEGKWAVSYTHLTLPTIDPV